MVWGIVPARGGSKGVPGKNLRKVGGLSLVERAVRVGLESGLENVLVSTDDEGIARQAVAAGAQYLGPRPRELSSDGAHMFPAYKHGLQQLLENGEQVFEFIALLPTNPFRTVDTVRRTLELLQKRDWVFSVSEMEHHPYRAMKLIDDESCIPYFPIPAQTMWANRQELPEIYRFNGVAIAGHASNVFEHEEYDIDGVGTFASTVGYVKTSQLEAFDIDTELDLEVAQYIWSSRQKS